jgi:hypothetical protein
MFFQGGIPQVLPFPGGGQQTGLNEVVVHTDSVCVQCIIGPSERARSLRNG